MTRPFISGRRPVRWLTLAAVAAGGLACRDTRLPAQPLNHSAYVWQRVWTSGVSAAVRQEPPGVGRWVVLAAQVDWSGDAAEVVRVPLDYAALRESHRPVGLALRIGLRHGALPAQGAAVADLCALARTLLDQARAEQLEPAELQVDYDCPESRLGEYARWVTRLKAGLRPTPVRITVLPSWLHQPACRDLVGAVDGFVLQVHGLQAVAQPPALIDLEQARAAVETAGHLGVRFDVALPTYAYWLARDAGGAVKGVVAEGAMPDWPADVRQAERVRAPPALVAGLVREWGSRRPAAMDGVIWYRLPVAGDTMNWAPSTWRAVMQGKTPTGHPRSLLEWRTGALVDIAVTNAGDDEVGMTALDVKVDLGTTNVVAADGVGGFVVRRDSAGLFRFVPADERPGALWLRPGEKRVIGWVRLGTTEGNDTVSVRALPSAH